MSASVKKLKDMNARLPSGRCSFGDLEIIKTKAARSGLSVSEYMRSMCVYGEVHARTPKADIDLILQLRRIGINLNQQTKRLNAQGGELPPPLVFALSDLRSALASLL